MANVHVHVYDDAYVPCIWLSMTMIIVVEAVPVVTSEQVIAVPLWLLLTAEIINLDDTGLPSVEVLVNWYVVELSVSWSLCASAGPTAVMACVCSLRVWGSFKRGKLHSRSIPVTLHVNSSLSLMHTLSKSEGDNITPPETEFSLIIIVIIIE